MARSKPYVILNAAMTLDGKIATVSRDSKISSKKDLQRVHELRRSVDAIMVGINTVITDDPLLTVRYGKSANKPIRIIVDSRARISPDSRIMQTCATIPTIIAVSEYARSKIERLRDKKAEILICGKRRVDLSKLLSILYNRRIKRLLLEGGGELNWSMLQNSLVDEVIITISPRIVGGREAITLVEGEGFTTVKEGVRLALNNTKIQDNEIVLFYKVKGVRNRV